MSIQMMRPTPKPYPPNKKRAVEEYAAQLNLFISEARLPGVSAVLLNEMLWPVVVLYDTEKNRDRAKDAIRKHFQCPDFAFRKRADPAQIYVPRASSEPAAAMPMTSRRLPAGERYDRPWDREGTSTGP